MRAGKDAKNLWFISPSEHLTYKRETNGRKKLKRRQLGRVPRSLGAPLSELW